MLKIDRGQNITITRGDTLSLTLELTKDGEPYTPVEGDALRFAISKEYEGAAGYELILEKAIPTNTLTFTLTSTQMKLAYGEYNYDVEITHPDGAVDTFISARLKVTGEVK